MKPTPLHRDVIVIGASAGGIEAVTRLLTDLARPIRVAICITLHRGAFPGHLGEVLSRKGRARVEDGRDGERLGPGRIFCAPSDRHLLFEGDVIRLDRGPKEHHTRPAIDPMMRSAAEAFGRRVIGVLLTGNLSDGVSGLVHVKHHGGLAIVQDPSEASFPSMPESALRYDHVDVVSRLDAMPGLLAGLASGKPVARAVLDAQEALPVRPRRAAP